MPARGGRGQGENTARTMDRIRAEKTNSRTKNPGDTNTLRTLDFSQKSPQFYLLDEDEERWRGCGVGIGLVV